MGTTLTGTTPQDTYDSLIKVTDNGPISATAKYLSDGLGNDSALAVSTARVGVGLNTPTVKLESSGAVKAASISFGAEGGYLLNFGGNAASRSYRIANDANSFGDFVIQQSTTQTGSTYADRLAISAAGNVGIGTSSPAALLSLSKSANASININTAATGTFPIKSGISFGAATTTLGGDANYTGGAGIQGVNIAQSDNVTDLLFWTTSGGSPSEKVRVLSSGGITFNGDTAAANALDDYEEGTWTMGVSFGGGTTGITYANNTGAYTKIGRQVTVTGYLALSSKGSSTGSAFLTGLPFTISGSNSAYSIASLRYTTVTFANQFQAEGVINTTTIELTEITEAGAVTALNDANFANNSTLIVSFTYFV
jgi:hypothetical protein